MMTVELAKALLRRDTPLFPVLHCKKATAKPKYRALTIQDMVRAHVYHRNPRFGTDVHATVIPRMTFEPVIHLHYSETLLPMKGGLPKLRGFPGSGDCSRAAGLSETPD